jgi:Protein of unknown function (DUF1566)
MIKKLLLLMFSLGMIASGCKKETSSKANYINADLPKFEFNDKPSSGAVIFPLDHKFTINAVSTGGNTAPFTYETTTPSIIDITKDGIVTMKQSGPAKIVIKQGAADGFNAAVKELIFNVPAAKIAEKINNQPVYYQGGIIFKVIEGVQGLVAAKEDQSSSINWWGNGGAYWLDTDKASGFENTQAIIIHYQNEMNYAAKACTNYNVGGTGWYLPSYYELETLFHAKTEVGGFSGDNYWTSTEYSGTAVTAWTIDFSDGQFEGLPKSEFHSVRAIKKF